jgi:hypothetical protein
MCKKQDIVDILKSEMDRIKLNVRYDGMYDKTAEKIMELFEDDQVQQQENTYNRNRK